MSLSQIWDYLLPGSAEQDEGFREEIRKLSHRGLYVIAGVQLGVALMEAAVRLTVLSERWSTLSWVWETVLLAILGGITLAVAEQEWSYRHSRLIGVLGGALCAAILIWGTLLQEASAPGAEHTIPGKLAIVMLVGLAALPMLPMQALAMGLSFGISYLLLVAVAWQLKMAPSLYLEPTHLVFISMLALLSAALTALVYAQRHKTYLAHREAVKASEDLCQVQSRVLLAENAAALGRLAAALSHEFNSPIGSLLSGLDTLTGLAAKLRSADAEERQRLLELQTDLCRSISGSAKRLKQIVGRIQRFTNLEGAEIQPADLNQLLNDTAALLQPKIRDNIELELRLEPLPPVLCRPEQMSAVFSSLLSNAIRAVSGAGRIEVSTVRAQDQVRVQIRDNGRGMTPEELAAVFYPGFKVQAGRVATGNWSLFSSRQIIHEHGGEIRIESVEGRGTSVNVLLPFQSARVEVLSA